LTTKSYFNKSGYRESEQAILALAALAQPTRLGVFRLLVRHEPDGLAAGDIAKALVVPQNTMSAHLAILARAQLVIGARQSRSIIYRANLAAFQDLTSFMVEDCCGGRADLCAPVACKPQRGKRSKVTAQG
jgi:ArsR family transcriptional regulator, arsenate/arsenite/antimonite-responsive transcriptional repressor